VSLPGWLAELRAAGNPLGADLAPLVFACPGLGAGLLTDRLAALADRHEALRLTWPGGTVHDSPDRVVAEALDVWETPAGVGEVEAFGTAMALAGYRRAGAPLWRAWLAGGHLVVGLDRMIADPWSLHVLAQELSLLCRHGASALPGPRPAALGAVLAERNALAEHPDALGERAFWHRAGPGTAPGGPRIARVGPVPALTRPVPLTTADTRALVALAASHRTTVLAVVAAAVDQVSRRWFCRHAGDTALLTEVGYRHDPALDGAIAPLMEPRPLRIPPGGGSPVARARDALLDVLDNSSVPLAADPTPLRPFLADPGRMTVLVEFDTPNRPAAPGSLLTLLQAEPAGQPRADLRVRVRGEREAPELSLCVNPLAVRDAAAAEFADAVVVALRGL
jgi:hypothetical protein